MEKSYFLSADSFYFPSIFLEMIPRCPYFFIKSHISILLRPMEFSLKQVKSGWSIVYIEGSKIIFLKKRFISFSEDLDEMSHHVAFHLGLHSLSPEVPVLWFLVKKNMLNFQIFSRHAWYARYVFVNSWCWCSAYVARTIESSSPPPHGE